MGLPVVVLMRCAYFNVVGYSQIIKVFALRCTIPCCSNQIYFFSSGIYANFLFLVVVEVSAIYSYDAKMDSKPFYS